MSKTKAAGDVPQVPADPVPPAQTPTVTHYQQIAANLAKAIDDMLALVPNFVADAHPATKAFVRRRQNVPIAFIATAIAAVDANPELQGIPGFDVTDARDSLQYIDAFRPMVDLLSAAKENLAFNIESRRANAGDGALQLYAVAKGIARSPRTTTVASHVSNLRRDLGKAGKGGKKKAPPTPGTPAPAPVPAIPMESVIGGLTADEQA